MGDPLKRLAQYAKILSSRKKDILLHAQYYRKKLMKKKKSSSRIMYPNGVYPRAPPLSGIWYFLYQNTRSAFTFKKYDVNQWYEHTSLFQQATGRISSTIYTNHRLNLGKLHDSSIVQTLHSFISETTILSDTSKSKNFDSFVRPSFNAVWLVRAGTDRGWDALQYML